MLIEVEDVGLVSFMSRSGLLKNPCSSESVTSAKHPSFTFVMQRAGGLLFSQIASFGGHQIIVIVVPINTAKL